MWLADATLDRLEPYQPGDEAVPEECRRELKLSSQKDTHSLFIQADSGDISKLIDCENYSTLHRLLRVTKLVLRFVRLTKERVQRRRGLTVMDSSLYADTDKARTLWLQVSQSRLPENPRFSTWQYQLGLYKDSFNLWRCGGRISNASLPDSMKNPILLDKTHHLTTPVVRDAHRRVLHNGVRETLTEVRSAYWIVRGRQYVRSIIDKCVICRRIEGPPYKGKQPPPLPEFRVSQSRPFQFVEVDFAGPLYVKPTNVAPNPKSWLCLFTCCTTRAVHLELVPDLSTVTFMNCFKRFSGRRGIPSKIISDNGKTFKAASRIIAKIFSDDEVQKHFSDQRISWTFNLERAPWWGGFFERLIKSTKRCLKKVVGQSTLNYNQLVTLIVEVESVLNSRPLTYLSMDDLEEPVTPSHLICGYRVLSLPDIEISDLSDPDYDLDQDEISRQTQHLKIVLSKFWKRWRKEYLLELREHHRTRCVTHGSDADIQVGAIVTVYDDSHPRGMWRLGVVEELIIGADGVTRGARVRVISKTGRPTTLRRPIQLLYPLEVRAHRTPEEGDCMDDIAAEPQTSHNGLPDRPPRRAAALQARDKIIGWMID